MTKKKGLSQEDQRVWENYTNNPSGIYDKEKNISNINQRKERFRFDLHGYTLENANHKIKEVIKYCVENRYKEILIITGKGNHSTSEKDAYVSKQLGKLKHSVPEFIRSDEELSKVIISINIAKKIDGGDGALIIKLKNL